MINNIEDRIKCVGQVREENKIYCLMELPCSMKDKANMKPIKLYDTHFGDSKYHDLPTCRLYDILKEGGMK